jgi:predicted ATPase
MVGGTGLVGRDGLRAELRHAIDATTQGGGRMLLLAGEPGIGKTTLLTEALRYARSLGARAVPAACW